MSAVRREAADYASITQRIAFGRIVVPVRMSGGGMVSGPLGISRVCVNRVRFG